MISVFGIGSPLMDYVVYESHDFLARFTTRPGTMHLITHQERAALLSQIQEYKNIPGGSCANTLRGIAWLSRAEEIAPTFYCGAVGGDEVGERYLELMQEFKVGTHIVQKKNPTGVSICIVTPDHERTMFTFLGACQEFEETDVACDQLQQAKLFHFTGYMWDTENQRKAIKKTIQEAKKNKLTISFDLADPFVVGNNKENFLDWIPKTVDILFGNRDEISSLLGMSSASDDELIREAGTLAPIVLMKVGARGCYVKDQNEILHVPGEKVKVVDTIGAGDFFAAGFLYGFITGATVKESARLANTLAAEIVTVEGCSIHKIDPVKVLRNALRPAKEPN